MSIKNLSYNAFWSLVTHVFTRGSVMLATMIVGRSFDTTSFATFSYFNITISVVATFATLGLSVGASRFFAGVKAGISNEDSRKIFAIAVMSCGLGCAGFIFVLISPESWLGAGLGVPKIFIAGGVLLLTVQGISSGALLGLENYRATAFVGFLSSCVFISIVFISAVHGELQLCMLAYLISAFIQLIGNIYLIIQDLRGSNFSLKRVATLHDYKEVLNFVGPIFLTSMLAASGSWLVGRIILASEGGEKQFGLYVIALQWFSLTLLLPGMVSRVLLPKFVRMAKDDNSHPDLRKMTVLGGGATFAVATVLAVLFTLLSPTLLGAYGSEYVVGKELLTVFLLAAVICAPLNTLGNAIVSFGGQFYWLTMTLVWFAVLCGMAVNLRSWGAIGAATSYVVSYTIFTVIAVIFSKKRKLI